MAIRAERSSALKDIGTMMRGHHLTMKHTVMGIEFTMHTLEPFEIMESDSLAAGETALQSARSHGRAQVAYAITHINGVPIEEHFKLPTQGDPDELAVLQDKEMQRRWRRMEVWDYLVHECQDEVLAELWEQYVKLLTRKREAMKAVPGESNGTPSTASSPT